MQPISSALCRNSSSRASTRNFRPCPKWIDHNLSELSIIRIGFYRGKIGRPRIRFLVCLAWIKRHEYESCRRWIRTFPVSKQSSRFHTLHRLLQQLPTAPVDGTFQIYLTFPVSGCTSATITSSTTTPPPRPTPISTGISRGRRGICPEGTFSLYIYGCGFYNSKYLLLLLIHSPLKITAGAPSI